MFESKRNMWKVVLPTEIKIQRRKRMGWSLEEDDEFNLGLVTFEMPMEHAVKASRQN